MVIAWRLAGAVASHAISIGQAMGEAMFCQPVEGAVQADAVEFWQALVQLRMAKRPTGFEQCRESDKPGSCLSASSRGDQAACEHSEAGR